MTKNYYVTWANRQLNMGDNFTGYHIQGKAVRAENPLKAKLKALKDVEKSFDVEIMETEKFMRNEKIKSKIKAIHRI